MNEDGYVDGVLAGERRAVAKTITLLESQRAEDVVLGEAVLSRLAPKTGGAIRVGVSGSPGVGKSSFIETLGLELIDAGQRVAVLAVDPSSPRSGGSILGDKTRMVELGRRPEAFIRPSPSGGALGGVAHRTREALLVCEAAGFEVVLVETVGVGQSEAEVESMVDFFAVLLQPGAGDELQGIKRGVLELADAIVVNKADGESRAIAERSVAEYRSALELLRPRSQAWKPRVLAASALEKVGLDDFWDTVLEHRQALQRAGELERRRAVQARAWFWRLVRDGLDQAFRADPGVKAELAETEAALERSELTAPQAARRLLAAFTDRGR